MIIIEQMTKIESMHILARRFGNHILHTSENVNFIKYCHPKKQYKNLFFLLTTILYFFSRYFLALIKPTKQ